MSVHILRLATITDEGNETGGPGYTLFESYSGALLVAGGSGITFVLSMLSDLLQRHEEGCSRLRVIEVVWSVADPCKLLFDLLTVFVQTSPHMFPHTFSCSRCSSPDPYPVPTSSSFRELRSRGTYCCALHPYAS